MGKKNLWVILSCLLVLSVVLASCTTKSISTTTPTTTTTTIPKSTTATTTTTTTTTATTTTATTTTATGNWWDSLGVPQYGGTITFSSSVDANSFDPYYETSIAATNLTSSMLCMRSWTLNPAIWPQSIEYSPENTMAGDLAESWEEPDPQTVIFHLRKGIYWQNISPVNGREMTASDIVFTFQRLLGLGSFKSGSPYVGISVYSMVQSITATDKYTVVFKSQYPTVAMMDAIDDQNMMNEIVAPEAVQQWGNVTAWNHVIGTGPFIMTDYVSGGSITYTKNPNYYGHDERYPKNQLPYLDGAKILIIPDPSTNLAAIRTGKIDLAMNVVLADAVNMAKTNPDIKQAAYPYNAFCLELRTDKAPFTDRRVRKALQMAMDLPTIANTYYYGRVTGTPYPLIGPSLPGYYFPYTEWPKTLQDDYAYNPQAAMQLLTEAGYPKGFTTDVIVASTGAETDLNLLQVVKSYLAAINVNMDIVLKDAASFKAYTRAGNADQMIWMSRAALTFSPLISLGNRVSTSAPNMHCVNDPVYDAMVAKAGTATSLADAKAMVQACDKYADEQEWHVIFPTTVTFGLYQPWLKGFNGQYLSFLQGSGTYTARFWIDQTLKH
jgi:peptide/nickel transport system substrate-binding protein